MGEGLDPAFKVVLFIVTAVTLLLLLVMIVIAVSGATSASSKDLFSLSSDMFKVGFGAIVGLLGGKKL